MAQEFFMTSSETSSLADVRRCQYLDRVSLGQRHDLMLVSIEPPLIGQQFGLGGHDVSRLIIAPRHRGVSLFPISEWPVHVHVFIPELLDELGPELTKRSWGWAEIHPTEGAAALARPTSR
jgi:hypothetical protein